MKTKHRIIGLVVLVALAVVIVPLFFARSGPNEKTAALSSHVPTAPGQPEIQQIAIPAQQDATTAPTKSADAAPSSDLATQPLQAAADNNPQTASATSPDDTQTAAADESNIQPTVVAQQNTAVAPPANSNSNVSAAAAVVAAENEIVPDTSNSTAQPATITKPTSNVSTANDSAATNQAPAVTKDVLAANSNNAAPTQTSSGSSAPAASAPDSDAAVVPKAAPEKTAPRNKSGTVKRHLAEESGHQFSHNPKKHEMHEAATKAAKAKAAELANAWSVQLGSFSQKENAEKLVKELRSKGYTAYLHQAKSEKGSINRVYVGPELKREKAEAVATKLLETLNLKGVVVKYDV